VNIICGAKVSVVASRREGVVRGIEPKVYNIDICCFLANKTSVLFSDGPDKAFLVPDSCRVTEGSGNSINGDNNIGLALVQHAYLSFFRASSLKQQASSRYVSPPGHIFLIPS
jgi:hypothetical protein